MLILIVAGGPDKGRIYELFDDKPVVIGRDGADLQFSDVKVSRRHARIWCEGGRWYLEDLNSRHGTHRNHKDIQDEWQPLKDGDYIQVGKTVMVLARMSAEHLEQVKADAGFRADAGGGSSKFKLIMAGSAVAAAILIALNVAVLVNANRGVDRINEQVATTTQRAFDAERDEQAQLRTMIAELGESSDAVVPKLDTVLAMIDAQPNVAGQLDALALAIADRRPTLALTEKIDNALALLEARGEDTEALAEQFQSMLAAQPTMDQIAAATRNNNQQTVAVLSSILEKLDSAADEPVETTAQQVALADELAQLRELIETRSADNTPVARELKPLLEQVLTRVEDLGSADDTQTLLAAIAEVKTALPADNSATLTAMLDKFDGQPTNQDLQLVNQQLAALSEQLGDRADAQLIQQQLARLIEASAGQPDAALAAADDPILGQILAQVENLAAQEAENDKKFTQLLTSLEKQPYENRAMLDEALAQLGGNADEADVASLLDNAMAELRGKSITDAAQLRRMIQREVVVAVGKATGEPVERDRDDSRLTRTELAYKRAFETDRRITIGVTRDTSTGQMASGRTLDPAVARVDGHETWRDWYLMDDLANRMRLDEQAQRVAARDGATRKPLAMPEIADVPDTNIEVNASNAPDAE